jgi:nucleotide-binding universal stress UspA family protein
MENGMTASRRVVFGDDDSPSADVVWLWLNNHRWPGWQADVVRAELPDPSWLPVPADLATLHAWDPPQPRVAFAEAGFAAVRHLTAVADPRLVLQSCRDAALLAVGPRGRGWLKAIHVGSTTEWLLLRPPAPLVIVRSARPVRHVLVCVDGSPHAARAVSTLAYLPWLAEVSVTVVGVEDRRTDVPASCRAAAEELQPLSAGVDVRITEGPPTPAIHEMLDSKDTQLVVLGTRGHTGLKTLTLGSTASSVARVASCSALVATAHDADT